MPTLRHLLRHYREQCGLSQEELAMLVEPPLSPDTISNLERGRTRPHRHTLEVLCRALRLDENGRQTVWAAWRAAGTDKSPVSQGHATVRSAPAEPTPLIGRELELQALQRRVLQPQVRLLTLVGPGGVGKTRLALGLLHRVDDQFRDGVSFVDLSALHDASLVLPTIAQELGIHEAGSGPLVQFLIDALDTRQVLLVLDNFEQLLEAGSGLARLLSACADLKLLVTSREPLRLRWEHLYVVRPLAAPDQRDPFSVEAIRAAPAVALFIDRARAADETFALTAANAAAIAEVCRSLDGLPLALELAAAAVRTLSPAMLLEHLDRHLDLLKGARDAPARQRSLRATLDWSYGLLSEAERGVFERLSVFTSGCTLDSAEEVCSDELLKRGDVLDLLGQLVDKSLVIAYQHNDGAVRYVMHETVRQYAAERLLTRGDAPVVVNRFIAYYVGLTERAFAHLRQADEGNWFQQLGTELSNLRTALQLCKDYDDSQRGLRLATALTRFWRLTGFASEGRYWLSQFLSTDASPADQSQRAWALHGLGRLALAQGDVTNALTTTEESLAIARRLPDQLPLMVEGLHQLGWIRHWQGDTMSARSALEEGLALARDIGNERQVADHLSDLADLLRLQGERARAREFYRESLELTRTLDDPTGVATNQACLGSICLAEGEHLEAARLLRGALQLYTSFHNRLSAVVCIAGLGGVAASRGQSDKAARLLASVDALLTSMGAQLDPADRADFERSLALCRTQVDDAAFVIAWAEGQALRLEQAIDLALTA